MLFGAPVASAATAPPSSPTTGNLASSTTQSAVQTVKEAVTPSQSPSPPPSAAPSPASASPSPATGGSNTSTPTASTSAAPTSSATTGPTPGASPNSPAAPAAAAPGPAPRAGAGPLPSREVAGAGVQPPGGGVLAARGQPAPLVAPGLIGYSRTAREDGSGEAVGPARNPGPAGEFISPRLQTAGSAPEAGTGPATGQVASPAAKTAASFRSLLDLRSLLRWIIYAVAALSLFALALARFGRRSEHAVVPAPANLLPEDLIGDSDTPAGPAVAALEQAVRRELRHAHPRLAVALLKLEQPGQVSRLVGSMRELLGPGQRLEQKSASELLCIMPGASATAAEGALAQFVPPTAQIGVSELRAGDDIGSLLARAEASVRPQGLPARRPHLRIAG